jgi:hypothetical protein
MCLPTAAAGPPLAGHLTVPQRENAARGMRRLSAIERDFSNRYASRAHIP